jgi:hypothetical protein
MALVVTKESTELPLGTKHRYDKRSGTDVATADVSAAPGFCSLRRLWKVSLLLWREKFDCDTVLRLDE